MDKTHRFRFNITCAIAVLSHLQTSRNNKVVEGIEPELYDNYVSEFIGHNLAGSLFPDDPILTHEGQVLLRRLRDMAHSLKNILEKANPLVANDIESTIMTVYLGRSELQRQAIFMLESALEVYVHLQDEHGEVLIPHTLHRGMSLATLDSLSVEKAIPETTREDLLQYLYSLPGYCLKQRARAASCHEHHQTVLDQFEYLVELDPPSEIKNMRSLSTLG